MAKTFNFEIITPVRVVYNGVVRAFLLMGLKDRLASLPTMRH